MKWVSVTIGVAGAALVLSGAGFAYEGVAVSNGGTIKGQVKYEGTPPPREKIEITKDARVCGTETEKLKEDLVVSAGGGIANAVVKLDIAKGAPLEPANPNPTLDQRVCQFHPHVLAFPAGSTLDVLNSDGILHNVHTYPEINSAINKAQPGFKKQIQLKFEKPEFPIRIECDAHPWMKGWLVVEEHPYYAVTDENGNFTIGNVPAGDYEVEVWQETLGKKTGKVSVPAGGEASLTISFPAQ